MFNLKNILLFLIITVSRKVCFSYANDEFRDGSDVKLIFSKIDALELDIHSLQNVIEKQNDRLSALENLEERIEALEKPSIVPKDENSNTDDDLEERVLKLEDFSNVPGMMRTCYEYSQYGASISDDYLVDPDGVNMGYPPIKVFCDFSTGATEIYQDTEDDIEVEHCPDPGCFERSITYKNGVNGTAIPMTQIEALITLSSGCSQDFHYDCMLAPLHSGIADMVYWKDRHGMDGMNYFTGSNYGYHVCDCHYSDEGCVNEDVMGNTCSCDANLPVPEMDTGSITNKTALPITKVSAGGLAYETQSASFHLGRLKCFGKDVVSSLDSCGSLKKTGEMKSGYYNILKPSDEATSLVFCNMSAGEYDNLPETDATSLATLPLGSIVAWVPKTEKSSDMEANIPDGWQLCDGSSITKGMWSGLKTPDLNNEKRFLRGSVMDDALTMEEDMILDHEHIDGQHSHSDAGHVHSYTFGNADNHDCGMGGTHCAHDGTSTVNTGTGQASITSENSNIGKINDATPSTRKGDEVRPKNMHVSFIIRIY